MKSSKGFVTLDVGCGGNPRGDVNCDLYTKKSPHTIKVINPKSIPNFVACHAEFLPFLDRSFPIVHASHVLEHCKHPCNVLSEFKRVSKSLVYIKVPMVEWIFAEHKMHLYTWSKDSLRNLLKEFFPNIEISVGTAEKVRGNILRRLPVVGKALHYILPRIYKIELVAICRKS